MKRRGGGTALRRTRASSLPPDAKDDANGSRAPARGPEARTEPSLASAPSKPPPGLHLVATPIGHARDITLRALDLLAACDAIYCEDTRHTAPLLARYGIKRPLLAYHEHNAARVRPAILARLAAGESLALVSDAGTPLVSDPGFKLVRAAIAAGHAVSALPGASAVLAALSLSGLPCDRFLFAGFLPSRAAARRAELAGLAAVPATLVIFESPRRLAASLAEMARAMPRREAAVARELTKRFEEVRRGAIEDLARHYAAAGAPKGEIVVVLAPPEARDGGGLEDEALEAALARALETASLKDAVALIARQTGLSRRALYGRALRLRARGGTGP